MYLRIPDKEIQRTTTTRQSERGQRWLLIVLLMLCTLATSMNVADPDIWGHVQYGQDVIREGSIPTTNTYSFTATGYRWINHEHIAELVFASLAGSFGQYGLLFFKFLLSVAVFWSIIASARRSGNGTFVAGLVAVISAVSVSLAWSFRPQLFSFSFYVLMIILLNHAFDSWRDSGPLRSILFPREIQPSPAATASDPPNGRVTRFLKHVLGCQLIGGGQLIIPKLKFLWLAPILFLIWANTHGAFVAGICLFTAYLALRAVEILVRHGSAGVGLVFHLTIIVLATIGATLINPYGYRLHFWLLESLGEPRPEILEWAATDFFSAGGIRFGCVILLTVFSFAFSRRQKDFTHVVILIVTAWQAIEHFRHVPFFVFAAAFWIPDHLQSTFDTLKPQVVDRPIPSRNPNGKLAHQVLIGVAMVLVVLLGRQLRQVKVDRDQYPVSAIQFMKDHDIHGRLVVNFRWAQYALAALCAIERNQNASNISFDGRFRTCYPQEIVDQHFDFFLGDRGSEFRYRSPDSPPFDASAVLYHGHPDVVLISRQLKNSVAVMQERTSDWCLLYQDSLAQVWGLRVRFDDPQSPFFLPYDQRRITNDVQSGAVSWPAFPIERQLRANPSPRQIAGPAVIRI